VQLAQRLVSTLDDEIESGVEELWLAEAERRLEEIRSRKVKGIDGEEALRSCARGSQAMRVTCHSVSSLADDRQ